MIKHSDFFILSDNVQMIKRGWIERNRILKAELNLNGKDRWMYIKVPLKSHSFDTIIKDIEINNEIDWRDKIFKDLLHYKKKSPFYNETIEVVKKSLDISTNSIVDINKSALLNVCDYLGLTINLGIFTQMNIIIPEVKAPDEWALYACKALGFDEYVNPPGGIEIYDTKKYKAQNISIKFLKCNLPFYSQRRGPENFENGLSIIDVMMFNSPDRIMEMLDDYTFI